MTPNISFEHGVIEKTEGPGAIEGSRGSIGAYALDFARGALVDGTNVTAAIELAKSNL